MTITLEEVLKVQSHTYQQWRMFAFIIRKLSAMPGVSYWVIKGNIYAQKGSGHNRPCVVSHMDTVHQITSDLDIIKVGSRLTGFDRVNMRQTGIGGDDKVGVYITLQAILKNDNIKVAFFRDEECGCDGSDAADMDFFSDCGYVLQCDRQGAHDFVTNACGTRLSGKDFWKAIRKTAEKHAYRKCENGGMTDVYQLKSNGLNIAVANMSCGYYRPHSPDEYVDIHDVRRCEGFVMEVIASLGSRLFQHRAEPSYHRYQFRGNGKGSTAGRSIHYDHRNLLDRYQVDDDIFSDTFGHKKADLLRRRMCIVSHAVTPIRRTI